MLKRIGNTVHVLPAPLGVRSQELSTLYYTAPAAADLDETMTILRPMLTIRVSIGLGALIAQTLA
jgi:hypothetical protein